MAHCVNIDYTYFLPWELTSWLASVSSHCVTSLTLPLVDANLSLQILACQDCEEGQFLMASFTWESFALD